MKCDKMSAVVDMVVEFLSRYDDEVNMVIEDLVEGVLLIAEEYGNVELLAAVGKYRAEEKENYEVWGMRDDMEQAENELMLVFQKIAAKSDSLK